MTNIQSNFVTGIGSFFSCNITSNEDINEESWMSITEENDRKIYRCMKCGKVYSWKTNLRRHLRLECGMTPQFQCSFCSYITKRKSSLERHVFAKH